MERLSHIGKVFRREFHQRWSLEVFKVSSRIKRAGLNIYMIVDLNEDPVLGTFYEKELQAVTVDATGVFVVDHVIRTKAVRRKTFNLVRWRGYPSKFDSWISQDDWTPVGN